MRKQKRMERGAGVLLPVASLDSPYGIGSLGRSAYDFVDWLKAAGQRYWQVLPLGPTSYGDSPYQSFSAFAGNPYFIDLDVLIEEGLLTRDEVEQCEWGAADDDIDYAAIYRERFIVLSAACKRSSHRSDEKFTAFCSKHASWLEDYCLFMALKNHHGGREWQAWDEPLRLREPKAIASARKQFTDELDFWAFCQYKFYTQWEQLKSYANHSGISIIGDIPIYVSMDSADVWVNGELFQLDEQRRPTSVAGVPPDMFSATGQLWGNPLYNWERMADDGFAWWRARMSASAELYDVIRIDHFIGVVNYYSIPAEDTTAMNGRWISGPGFALMEAITPALCGKRIIAEDLGVMTPEVIRLRERCGYPGMKLTQFGFDSDARNAFLPCNYDQNQIVYGGTHDNETLVGYFSGRGRAELAYARNYLGVKVNKDIPWALIRAGYESSADTAIYQLQDLLGLDNDARINTPSTIGQNWRWRMNGSMLTTELADKLAQTVKLYGR